IDRARSHRSVDAWQAVRPWEERMIGETIAITDVYKSYGRTNALNGVTFQTARGITGLLGPNGAGKTTLLRMVATVLSPDRGSLRLLDRDPQDPHDRLEIRRRL